MHEAQLLNEYGRIPSLSSKIEQAAFHTLGGTKMIVMPWCESGHFFCLVGVIGAASDTIYVLESIGGYKPPKGALVLRDFMEVEYFLFLLARMSNLYSVYLFVSCNSYIPSP